MKKLLLVSIGVLATISASFAADYVCKVEANLERGFETDFQVKVSPVAVGGKIYLKVPGRQVLLGSISTVVELHRNVPAESASFNQILSSLSDEDTSGIKFENLSLISKIILIHSETNEDETIVYRFMDSKSKQIGGTFSMSGLGSSCLPL